MVPSGAVLTPKNARGRPVTKLCLSLETFRRTEEGRVRDAKAFIGHYFPTDKSGAKDRLFIHIPKEVRADLLSNWGIRGKKSALRDDDDRVRTTVQDALAAGDIDAATIEEGVTPEILIDWAPLDDWWTFWRSSVLPVGSVRKALAYARDLALFDERWFLDHLSLKSQRIEGTDVIAAALSKEQIVTWLGAIHTSGDASPLGLITAIGWDTVLTKTAHEALLYVLDALARQIGLSESAPAEEGAQSRKSVPVSGGASSSSSSSAAPAAAVVDTPPKSSEPKLEPVAMAAPLPTPQPTPKPAEVKEPAKVEAKPAVVTATASPTTAAATTAATTTSPKIEPVVAKTEPAKPASSPKVEPAKVEPAKVETKPAAVVAEAQKPAAKPAPPPVAAAAEKPKTEVAKPVVAAAATATATAAATAAKPVEAKPATAVVPTAEAAKQRTASTPHFPAVVAKVASPIAESPKPAPVVTTAPMGGVVTPTAVVVVESLLPPVAIAVPAKAPPPRTFVAADDLPSVIIEPDPPAFVTAPAPPPMPQSAPPSARVLFGVPEPPPMRPPAPTLSGVGVPPPATGSAPGSTLFGPSSAEVAIPSFHVPAVEDPSWAPPRAEPGDMGWDLVYGVKRSMATNVKPAYNFDDDDEPTSEIALPPDTRQQGH